MSEDSYIEDSCGPDCIHRLFDAEMERQIRQKVGHTKKYPCAECGGGLCELHDS